MLEAQKLHSCLLKSGLQSHVYRCNLVLNSYITSGALSTAHQVLASMPSSNAVSYNILLSGYIKSHRIDDALKLFDEMPHRDAHSWNITISGLSRDQLRREAVELFVRMSRSPIRPDNFSYSSVVPCCDVDTGRQMHAKIIQVCSCSDPFVGNNLVKMYAESGAMGDARKVFLEMPVRDLASWNVLMTCYAKFGMGELCLQVFGQLIRDGVRFDEFTLAIALTELANCLLVWEGMQVHSLMVRSGFCWDRFTCNALLNLYSKCGYIASATKLFEEMPDHDVVSWTALIMGLAASGFERDAFDAFHSMRVLKVEPNSFTFGSLIGSCASFNALQRGKQCHALTVKYGLELDTVVGSALLDMYSKCGEMNEAMRLFQSLPTRDLVSWNGMICGLAQNGEAIKALDLFNEMVRRHQDVVTPDSVTFVGVLTACSHGGLVYRGLTYFNDMFHKYSIKPQHEHYTCIVDLLARAGLLKQAESFIHALPFEPDRVILSALLGACRSHGDLEMAKGLAQQLTLDEPKNSSTYALLANMHSANGEWKDAMDVRETMCTNGALKVKGSSWIEISGHVHSFSSGHTHHPQEKLIYEVLQRLLQMMTDEGTSGVWSRILLSSKLEGEAGLKNSRSFHVLG